jgi:hypothetical protein
MTTAMARYFTPTAFSTSNDRFWSYNLAVIEMSSQKTLQFVVVSLRFETKKLGA